MATFSDRQRSHFLVPHLYGDANDAMLHLRMKFVVVLQFPYIFGKVKKSPVLELTQRFHVAVRLFSNRSQMTSKCGKNKKVAHEAIAKCVTDVLTTF